MVLKCCGLPLSGKSLTTLDIPISCMRLILQIVAFGVICSLQTSLVSRRVTEGLLAFYDFASEEGTLVKDRSGVGGVSGSKKF